MKALYLAQKVAGFGLLAMAAFWSNHLLAQDTKTVRLAAEPLEDVNWVYAATPGASGVLADGGRMMMLNFQSKDKMMKGTGPCNSFTASYEFGHEDLKFASIVATQLSCSFDKEEKAYIDALNSTRAYRIHGNELILLDGAGKTVARFEGSAKDPGPKPIILPSDGLGGTGQSQ